MKEGGASTGECMDGWTLQKVPVGKQQDDSSCGLFVLMESAVFKSTDFKSAFLLSLFVCLWVQLKATEEWGMKSFVVHIK